ncbi:MAG: SDR family oxidoreductase [Synergistaceae bacterium]|nr:SDR family oxidoreductase [Synergistaceae bacterium]
MGIGEKSAFVTEGTHPVCRELCLELAKRGYSVGFVYSSEDGDALELESRIKSLGEGSVRRRIREFSEEELSAAVVETAEAFGGIDALFFFMPESPEVSGGMLLDLDGGDWDSAMDRGAKGFFLVCKFALPYLICREGSRIVAIDPSGSCSQESGMLEGVSKIALHAALEHISRELSNYGISVEYRVISGESSARGIV